MTVEIGVPVIQLGLERISALLAVLGNPHTEIEQRHIPIVHVTGTNGKGSVVEMIANGLTCDPNCVVGVFSSPYLVTERDSIRIFKDGKPAIISPRDWSSIRDQIAAVFSASDPPSDFEVLFATAMVFFASQLDLTHLVVEVGMGGRLDATNVFTSPRVCVVTSIGLDHEKFLGDTKEKICSEKCGIFKRNCVAIVNGNIDESCLNIIADKFTFVGGRKLVVMDAQDTHNLVPPLNGHHQKQLFGIAIEAVMVCLGRNFDRNVLEKRIQSQTKLPGRLERRNDAMRPPLILDGAHNAESALALREFVEVEKSLEKKNKILWLLAVSEGRSEAVLSSLLRPEDVCVCVNFDPEFEGKATWVKCVPSSELANTALQYCETVYSIDGLVDEGLAFIRTLFDPSTSSKTNPLIVVAGSLYLVRNYLQSLPSENEIFS